VLKQRSIPFLKGELVDASLFGASCLKKVFIFGFDNDGSDADASNLEIQGSKLKLVVSWLRCKEYGLIDSFFRSSGENNSKTEPLFGACMFFEG